MQQRHPFLHEGEENLVVGILLRLAHLLDKFGMRLAALVQSAHLHLVCLQYAALHQQVQCGQCGTAGIHQLLAGNLQHGLAGIVALNGVPARHGQISDESFLLFGGPCQHVQGHVQRRFVAVGLCQADIRLCTGPVALLGLQSCGQRSLHHVADGRHVVIADPLPLSQLALQQDGLLVHQLCQWLHGVALGLCAVQSGHDAHIALTASEGHKDTHAQLHPLLHLLWNGIGECAVKRHRQDDVGVGHGAAKVQIFSLNKENLGQICASDRDSLYRFSGKVLLYTLHHLLKVLIADVFVFFAGIRLCNFTRFHVFHPVLCIFSLFLFGLVFLSFLIGGVLF